MQHGWISFPSTILRKYQRNIISLGRSSQHSALSHETAIETFIHRKSSLPLPLQTTDFWWHLLWYESRTPKEAGVGTGWWGLCSPLVRTLLVGIHCLLCSKEVGCSWEAERNTLLLSTMNQNAPAALLWTQASFHPTDLQYKPLQTSCCSRGMESSAFSSTHSPFIQTKMKIEPKALPAFWPSLLSGCETKLAPLQKGSNDKIVWPFPHCFSNTKRYSRFQRNQPLPFLSIIQYYWPAPLVHHYEGPAARNKELRKSQRIDFIIHGFAHCLKSIPIYKCSGKEGEVQERWRNSSRDSRNNPHRKSSSGNNENSVQTKRMNGWMNKSLSERGTATAHWCGLNFSPDAWGKEFPVQHWVCAWDTHSVDNSLIID